MGKKSPFVSSVHTLLMLLLSPALSPLPKLFCVAFASKLGAERAAAIKVMLF